MYDDDNFMEDGSRLLDEDDLFNVDLISVGHGTIARRDGSPLHLTDVIKRRWGWPKKAARLAGQHYRREGQDVFLRDPERRSQQLELVKHRPDILIAWMDGAARGSSRESHDAGRSLERIELRFHEPIWEEGLITGIVKTIGDRFGVSFQEIQSRITFQMGPLGERILHVKTKGLEDDA